MKNTTNEDDANQATHTPGEYDVQSCGIGEARQDSRAQIEARVTSCPSANAVVTSACRTPADRRKTQPPRVSFTESLPWVFRLRTPSAATPSGGGGTVHRSRPYGQRPAGRSAATRTDVAEDRPSRKKSSARTP
ncbi:hypothetical protein QTP88_004869 [Uroleucon formosanum]